MIAVAWSAIGLLAATLFGAFFYLGGRIDALGASLNGRIDALDSTLSARIDAMIARTDDSSYRWVDASTHSPRVLIRLMHA